MRKIIINIIAHIISVTVIILMRISRTKSGKSNRISINSKIYDSRIGNFCYIGPGCIFNKVEIGNYCSFAPYVCIGGMEHSYRWGSTSTFISNQCVDNLITIIEDDVWIGTGAIIKQGVKIERGAVIGAGSLVLHDVKSYSIVVGVPAREIKKRFNNDIINQIVESNYWNFEPKAAKEILSKIKYE